MITAEDLVAAGYRRHRPPATSKSAAIFQRWVERLYAITFFQYETGWSVQVTFYFNESGLPWVDVAVHRPESVKEVEEFYDRMYHTLGFVPDPHNQ